VTFSRLTTTYPRVFWGVLARTRNHPPFGIEGKKTVRENKTSVGQGHSQQKYGGAPQRKKSKTKEIQTTKINLQRKTLIRGACTYKKG